MRDHGFEQTGSTGAARERSFCFGVEPLGEPYYGQCSKQFVGVPKQAFVAAQLLQQSEKSVACIATKLRL